MKVSVLQEYLRSLVQPLRASGAAAKLTGDLETTCLELETFRDRDFADLAAFLQRARTYEEQGHWPAGGKQTRAASRSKGQAIPVPELADRLRAVANTPDAEAEMKRVEALTVPQLRELIKSLGIAGSFKNKPDGLEKIRAFLRGFEPGSSAADEHQPAPERDLDAIVARVRLLKNKAETAAGSDEDIESELRSLQEKLDARAAISLARALGITRSISTRAEALEEIRRHVFEDKLAREGILY